MDSIDALLSKWGKNILSKKNNLAKNKAGNKACEQQTKSLNQNNNLKRQLLG